MIPLFSLSLHPLLCPVFYFDMKRLITLTTLVIATWVFPLTTAAQTYTNEYPKELQKIAHKWIKKGAWKNGFTKAVPAPIVNEVEFYLQYNKNPEPWKQLFEWLQKTDLLALPSGKQPIPGTSLIVSVEDTENRYAPADLEAGKGSESHWQNIDVMYVVRGKEGFCRLDHDTSKPNIEYNLKKDRMEYQYDATKLEHFESIEGTFNIMFPCDWHIAKVQTQESDQHLRVLVIKMKVAM